MNVAERRLYLVQPGGVAIRYAVGVGREEALNFRGSAVIGRKAEWPHWSPTGDMIRRMPIYAHYVNGLPGGIGNPLGARALYLYRGNQDTYFRLHGTNEPDTIGDKVSSGCIRLFNQDIIDLYNRVPVGAPVVVLQEAQAPLSANAEAGGYAADGRSGGYGAGWLWSGRLLRSIRPRTARALLRAAALGAMTRVAAGEVIEGWLPGNAVRLVKEWTARHRAELESNWRRGEAGPVPSCCVYLQYFPEPFSR